MAGKMAPGPVKTRVRDLASGEIREVWPIDAREMVRVGSAAYVTDEEAMAAKAPVAPSAPQTTAATLATWSVKELRALIKRAGLDVPSKATKDEMIAALVPAVDGGGVSLEELPTIAVTPASTPLVTDPPATTE